jgi:enamine deaminase RidA (YjgF/YER057c/UK114 family)
MIFARMGVVQAINRHRIREFDTSPSPIISQARAPFFAGRPPPASTLIGVAALALPEWLIEIEAVAVIG